MMTVESRGKQGKAAGRHVEPRPVHGNVPLAGNETRLQFLLKVIEGLPLAAGKAKGQITGIAQGIVELRPLAMQIRCGGGQVFRGNLQLLRGSGVKPGGQLVKG